MDYLFDLVYVQGDILATGVKVLILVLGFDFLITFGGLIKTIKTSI